MLTKIDIDSQYYKVHKHLINTEENPINVSDRFSLPVLFDSEYRILAIANNFMSIKAMATFDKTWGFGLGLTAYEGKTPAGLFIKRAECWKFKLNLTETSWEENLKIRSIEQLNDYILISQKVFHLDKLHQTLDSFRMKNMNESPFQLHTYMAKYLEAKEVLEKNIETDPLLVYPYVTGYAKLKGLTLQQSANAIKIQHEIQSGFLSESENIRLKYKDLIANETDISKLKMHFDDFMIENDMYGAL